MYIDSINVREYWRDSSFEEFNWATQYYEQGLQEKFCKAGQDCFWGPMNVEYTPENENIKIKRLWHRLWGPSEIHRPFLALRDPDWCTGCIPSHRPRLWDVTALLSQISYKGHDLDLCWVLQGGRMKDEQCMLWWLFQWWLTCVLFLYFFYNNHISFSFTVLYIMTSRTSLQLYSRLHQFKSCKNMSQY